jgi:hypothetical protein
MDKLRQERMQRDNSNEIARRGKFPPLHFKGGASVLANPSDKECDVVLLFVWIELANVGDNRVDQS